MKKMTNEKKVIAQLKDMLRRCTNGYDAEALYLAIKALEYTEQRKEKEDEEYRQDTI